MGESFYKKPLQTTWALTEISINYLEPQTGCFLKYIMMYIKVEANDTSKVQLLLECQETRTESAAGAVEPTSIYLG